MRENFEVDGLTHQAPIPSAARIGPMLATSGIGGKNRESGIISPDIDEQARHCFENLKHVLSAAGMGLADVLKMTIYVTDDSARESINRHWNECFPDAQSRPARHTLLSTTLRGGMKVQLEVLALAQPAP